MSDPLLDAIDNLTDTFSKWREEERRTHKKLDEELGVLKESTAELTVAVKEIPKLTKAITDINSFNRRTMIGVITVLLAVNGYLLVFGPPWAHHTIMP